MEKLLQIQKQIPSSKKGIKKLPEKSGVYVFLNDKGIPIYVGKANNLNSRVSSYFAESTFGKAKDISQYSKNIKYIVTSSEFEALILESDLIKKFKPKYNVSAKDDKSPLYIKITNDKYPRILNCRKSDLNPKDKYQFGPYPSSEQVYSVLKMVRKIFPYSDHLPTKHSCIYKQIKMCFPCPSDIENEKNINTKEYLRKEYLLNIRHIKSLLKGQYKSVLKDLEKKMKVYSKELDFEKAQAIKIKIDNLNYITQSRIPPEDFLKNPNFVEDLRIQETKEILIFFKKYFYIDKINRIECFDVAHISGSYTTASMVTFENAEPSKKYYRHFRVRTNTNANDIQSLSEIISRRITHFVDWGKPDLIIVDGGSSQVNVFLKSLKGSNIPVVGLSKREETLIIPNLNSTGPKFIRHKLKKGNVRNLIVRLRNEAHRFARRYHHKLIKKDLLKVS